ncbi:DUF6880 family protein [Microbacterium kunmingense]|uniref:DUF6880 family protein n=1 Tax=Microbacterium kunmingense TaxID=2915939 RepID=UPI002003C8B9|nr:DUF6880 family protein [Microbacterium kunmingense]
MTALADAVLPLVRSRSDLHRWSAANQHGGQMHEAIDVLEAAIPTTDPAEAYTVTHKALASAIKVIARADDSSGIIGDACRRLLTLHPQLADTARTPPSKLVPWMITFQFDGDVDYFELDPVAYAPALGDKGLRTYRARLDEIRGRLAPKPDADSWQDPSRHERWVLEWNERRLAVLDRDIDAIIRTHARDRKVAAWFHDTAKAFDEIGETELAIDWARQATDFGHGHQSQRAAEYWCTLLSTHHPDQLLAARDYVFRRWPNALNASRLHATAGPNWPDYEVAVTDALAANPADAVTFTLTTLKNPQRAWQLAHQLDLTSDHTWDQLTTAYEKIDPIAVLPTHRRLVENTLTEAGAANYRDAAKRLARMRRLTAGTDHAIEVDELIAELRDTHRRRPRLQQEFDRAKLP